MSVWISDEKLLIFASLISPSKMILFEKKYQTFDTVFHHQMKHLEVRQKYSGARRIFNSLLGVSSGDETLHLMFDILQVSSNLLSPSGVPCKKQDTCISALTYCSRLNCLCNTDDYHVAWQALLCLSACRTARFQMSYNVMHVPN